MISESISEDENCELKIALNLLETLNIPTSN